MKNSTQISRKNKVEQIKRIIESDIGIYDSQPWLFIVQKDGKNYLADGFTIGREISDSEIARIKCPKIFIDEQFLSV